MKWPQFIKTIFRPSPPIHRTARQVADTIENFVNGTDGKWDWDDFLSFTLDDYRLEAYRDRCNRMSETHPPIKNGYYCSDEGFEAMRQMVRELRRS
jgi:hypothetical protein